VWGATQEASATVRALAAAVDIIRTDDALWAGFVVDLVRVTLSLTPDRLELAFIVEAMQVPVCPCARVPPSSHVQVHPCLSLLSLAWRSCNPYSP
jgi:hypothetical protein